LNHRLVADLGGSGDAIDALIAKCKEHGALAAKLAGAGLGGTVIALTEDPSALEAGLRTEGYTRFLRPSIERGCRLENLTEESRVKDSQY
jgi:mevalonate kinase